METIVALIKIEEERKKALIAEYEALDGESGAHAFDYETVVRELRERTADVQAVLTRQTSQARQMLRKLLDGKIAVEPITLDARHGFRLSGRLNVGRLLRADVLRAAEAATRPMKITVRRWWPQRDLIELAEFKCAVSLRADWTRPAFVASGGPLWIVAAIADLQTPIGLLTLQRPGFEPAFTVRHALS
jgi:hypothetical protein